MIGLHDFLLNHPQKVLHELMITVAGRNKTESQILKH